MKLKFKTEFEQRRYDKLHNSLVRIEVNYDNKISKISYEVFEYYEQFYTKLISRFIVDYGFRLIGFNKENKTLYKYSLKSFQDEKTLNDLCKYNISKYNYHGFGSYIQVFMHLL